MCLRYEYEIFPLPYDILITSSSKVKTVVFDVYREHGIERRVKDKKN